MTPGLQGRAALLAVLLAALPSAARPATEPEPSAAAPEVPAETRVGAEFRLGMVRHLRAEVDPANRRVLLGAEVFLRRGWLRIGLGAELHPMDYKRGPGWLRPGESRFTRQDQVTAASAGLSLPGSLVGDGWLLHRLRADVLGELGLSHTRLYEDLGAEGIGNRGWDRWTPLVGARLALGMHLGRRFHGFWGVAAFYRHALRQERVTAATGRQEPVLGDSAGLVVFGGADLEVR